MAYFSNGTEGTAFQIAWCQKCIHDIDEDCPVILLSLLYNYRQHDQNPAGEVAKSVLDILMPEERKDNFVYPTCKLFSPINPEDAKPLSFEQERKKLIEWNKNSEEWQYPDPERNPHG